MGAGVQIQLGLASSNSLLIVYWRRQESELLSRSGWVYPDSLRRCGSRLLQLSGATCTTNAVKFICQQVFIEL